MITNDFDALPELNMFITRPRRAARTLKRASSEVAAAPQRRRAPRRQLMLSGPTERRQTDRRQRRPGVDGLMRLVISDCWP